MKIHSLNNPTQTARFGSLAGLVLLLAGRAAMADDTWTGGGSSDNWTDPANWGGTAPVALDGLIFDGGSRLTPNNNYPAGTIFGNLTFNTYASAFTVQGNPLVLTNGLDAGGGNTAGGGITNASFYAQTLNLPLTFSAGKHLLETDGGGQLNLSGALSRTPGAVALFSPNFGAINLAGSGLANANGILGGWAILGNDWAALDGSGNVVAYTGYADITTGAIANNPSANVRYINDTANLTAADGTTISSLLTAQGTGRSLTITGTMKLGSAGGIYRQGSGVMQITGGSLTANGGGEISLYAGPVTTATGNNLRIDSVIADDGANPVTVNIMGYNDIRGANTFTGGMNINLGRVQAGNVNAFGPSGGTVNVYPGGQAFLNTGGTYAQNFFISGVGSTESSGSQQLGAIRCNGNTISGTVTLRANARIASGSGKTDVVSGKITGPGQLEVTSSTGANSSFSPKNPNNDWSGGLLITVGNSGRSTYFKLGANEVIPDGPDRGDVTLNATSTGNARFDLNGFSETINGLNAAASTYNQVANYGSTPSTLTLGGNNATATFGGTLTDGSPGTLSLVKIGTGTQTLTGANTCRGSVTVNGGSLVFGAGAWSAATAQIAVNNATLDVSAVAPSAMSVSQSLTVSNGTLVLAQLPGQPTLATTNLNALGAANSIIISSVGAVASYPAQLPLITASNVTGTLNFSLGAALPPSPGTPYAGYISNNVANNSVDLVLTAGPVQIKWAGSVNSAWDGGTPNWKTASGAATTYSDSDFVTFDDSASQGMVSLNQTVSPPALTVSNSTLAYTFGGSSGISGTSTALYKRGTGKLTLDNGFNDFGGGVTLSGGTLQVGNNDTAGNLPATGAIVDNGALAFARTDQVTVDTAISGTGTLSQNGSGILTLNGANTFTGAVSVLQGTLQAGNNAALGTTDGGTTVSSGATLDVNGHNLGAEAVTVSGAGVSDGVANVGAIINSGANVYPALRRVTLAGHTTFGGAGRWDIRYSGSGATDPSLSSLSTGSNAFNLTKVGANYVGLCNVTIDPMLADINIQGGTLSLQYNNTSLGNPANTLTVGATATLDLYNLTNQVNKKIVLADQSTVANSAGANILVGPVTCLGNGTFNVNGASLSLNGPLGGAGTLTVSGTATLNLNGDGSGLTNGVNVTAGTLSLNGVLGGGLTNASGAALAGSGTNNGLVDVSGTLIPGASNVVGTLTLGSLVMDYGGSALFDLNYDTTPGLGSNDLVAVNGDLTMNGNIITINPLSVLQRGVPYTLFTYTGRLIWNADPYVTDSVGYTYTVNKSTPGKVQIVASGGPPIWNGGSASTSNWSDPANWGGVTIASGSPLYFAGNTRLQNNNDTLAGTSYNGLSFNVDAGPFVLGGNPITLNGNLANGSPNAQRINLGLTFNANSTFNGGAGSLLVAGGLTDTAAGFTTLTLAGNGTLVNQLASTDPAGTNTLSMTDTNGNWTLVDNTSSTPITAPWALDIRGGAFTFGNASSAPNLSTTTANGQPQDNQVGVISGATGTLTVSNGVLTTAARLNTATAANSTGVINVLGGVLNIGNQFQGANGSNPGEVSLVSVSGGTLNIGSATNPASTLYLASRGTGTLTVSGAGAVNCGTLDLSRNAAGNTYASVGTVNLNGGSLSVTRVGTATANSQAGPASTGGTPSATFNFNGGLLQARAGSATFFQGSPASPAIPITAIVKAGGAIIDSGTNNITILEPLQHDSSLGATPDGGLRKEGAGTLTLSAASTFSGPTLVDNGTLAVNGALGTNAVTVASGATLAGTGTLGGSVTVSAGGTVAPGVSGIGTLTVGGALLLQGVTAMDLNKDLATSDLLKAGRITFGGTLTVTNLSGTLAGGNSFKLFNATNYAGAFSSVAPAPGPGLAWDTSTLATDGTLRVAASLNTAPASLTVVAAANQLNVSWPADHIGWWLQVQTNAPDAGLSSNWVTLPASSTTNWVSVPFDPANGSVFYRMVYTNSP